MRLFVYEYTCATAAQSADRLNREGWSMLAAVLDDASRLDGVDVFTILHQDHAKRVFPADGNPRCLPIEFLPVRRYSLPDATEAKPIFVFVANSQKAEEEGYDKLAAWCDYTLLIAPEWQGILCQYSRRAEKVGARLLGPKSYAIEFVSDKLALARHWVEHHVPCPETTSCESLAEHGFFPAICKPRSGAGCLGISRIASVQSFPADRANADWIVQRLCEGQPASLAFLISPRQTIPLVPAAQIIESGHDWRYLGGQLPLPAPLAERAVSLAQKALAGIGNLQGYVGVDMLLGATTDVAIEINPRLTTSYIGLRALASCNLVGAMIELAEGKTLPALSWRRQRVRFLASGEVSVEPS
ncbi:MAG: hypothetical protein KatS3mg105_2402 [Gemmatales bacterium]|nr:MAG: hypothetical protein KatS3mg105_2402 [Gemmatales bacterium]